MTIISSIAGNKLGNCKKIALAPERQLSETPFAAAMQFITLEISIRRIAHAMYICDVEPKSITA
jgi:hypothetical protein